MKKQGLQNRQDKPVFLYFVRSNFLISVPSNLIFSLVIVSLPRILKFLKCVSVFALFDPGNSRLAYHSAYFARILAEEPH